MMSSMHILAHDLFGEDRRGAGSDMGPELQGLQVRSWSEAGGVLYLRPEPQGLQVRSWPEAGGGPLFAHRAARLAGQKLVGS